MIEIDWVAGIFVFLVFTSWAVVYYSGVFEKSKIPVEYIAKTATETIIDLITVESFEIPLKFYSPASVQDSILKAGFVWASGEKNSTLVYDGLGNRLPCRIIDDDLYFLANLSSGVNLFYIRFSDQPTSMKCNGTFPITSYNLTLPWSAERKKKLSIEKINNMTSTDYETFRKSKSISFNFFLRVVSPSFNITYGKPLPPGPTDVSVIERKWRVLETNEEVNITLAVW